MTTVLKITNENFGRIDGKLVVVWPIGSKCEFTINSIKIIKNPNDYKLITAKKICSGIGNSKDTKVSYNWFMSGDIFKVDGVNTFLNLGEVNQRDEIHIEISNVYSIEMLRDFEIELSFTEKWSVDNHKRH